ncbi:MAG: tRNA 4-thiouridine(8) synthase ThiI [Clostridiaceae bacterium]|jgi:thiamine biosynthesis protein ThiI|nr:tRNA 4-thiouridine(8) synthase ThiI [Clostridiaceae bacterium]
MESVILVRYEEIFLKGLNKHIFENKLIKNIKKRLADIAIFDVRKSQSRIYIESSDSDFDMQEAIIRLQTIFGIASVSPVTKIDSSFDSIKETSVRMIEDLILRKGYKTFKVEAKRADKSFPLNSPKICAELGAHILKSVPQLKVDVHNPDFIFFVEIREKTYLYSEIIPAAKGLPTGTGGLGTLLLSGGIDSPVAGWMIAKRGVQLEAVYFHSHPYTSDRAKDKVIKLARILSEWCIGIKLHVVPFTDIQLAINEKCPAEYLTIIMRRLMMRIAEKIALQNNSLGLITGEAIGQVASQTMESMLVTNDAVDLPVYRPLVGMDKNEVINLARKIGTYDTSILPYEDCCTIFVAKHPVTKPTLCKTIEYESVLNQDELIDEAIANTEVIEL